MAGFLLSPAAGHAGNTTFTRAVLSDPNQYTIGPNHFHNAKSPLRHLAQMAGIGHDVRAVKTVLRLTATSCSQRFTHSR
ncbi:hypothetical protein TMES_09095 [Thalassospira mesophila]|uniref:Uncharacterized protein n=1 Tax=Thalassospira mesophila TaxID=1293891 RepID=A0A1Y2L0Y7_9PROT|nr:hypothetical protein TMES_09095 [Thalassospira mesophila]